ncbi:Na+/melibiose symporter-like transporter [Sphingopyxis italica]|uniref:Na+/melibiose symporter-like transporter n=1 Tax=Sphingopyxis italica TaxID=1129133 RepID=A0A7X5XRK9_9SPHN|nr:MFS transporter [Sphingopyxis italica]NJB90012.1 Na+/melibiose symporter-like transporter [Sphingopyxis italica]
MTMRLRSFGYALCNVAVSVGSLPINLFLLYYLTEILGVRATLAGLAVALPKVWDALIDPMLGGWIDRLAVRMRRRWPILVISGLAYVGSLVAVFAIPSSLSMTAIVSLAIVLLIISSIAHTGIGISQFALATEMTSNPVELSKLLAMAAITAQILTVPASALIPLLIDHAGGGEGAYLVMSVQIAAFAAVVLAAFIAMTRRVPVRAATVDTQGLSTWESLKATGNNSAFYSLVALVVCLNGSITIQMGFLPFANQYVLGGSAATLSLLQAALGLSVVAGMLASPFLARRYQTIPSMRACNLLSVAALLAMFFASYGPVWMTVAAISIMGFGAGVIGVLIQTAILTAARMPTNVGLTIALGFYLGIMVAAIKLGGSAGSLVSGQFLALIGFQSGGAAQTETALFGLRLGYTAVPCILTLIGSFFLFRTVLPMGQDTADMPDETRPEPAAAV